MNEPVAAPAPVNQTEELEAVPASWPGAFGAYKYSKAAVMFNLRAIVLLILASIAAGLVYGIFDSALKLPIAVDQLFQIVLGIIVTLVEILVLFAGLDRVKMSLGEGFDKSKPFFLQFFIASILLVLIGTVSLLLLIVPFFIIMSRLALAPYFLVRKNLSATDSLKASWEASKGHVGKVYGTIGAAIAMALLMVTIIGIPFSIYFLVMYSAVWNVLYAYVVERNGASAAQAVPAEPAPAV